MSFEFSRLPLRHLVKFAHSVSQGFGSNQDTGRGSRDGSRRCALLPKPSPPEIYGATTGKVVEFAVTPFCFTTTVGVLVFRSCGTVKSIWYRPMPPGVRPA